MVDLTITIVNENGENVGQVTIYQDGSDAEATTQIIQWIVEEYQADESEGAILAPFTVINPVPRHPEQARPLYREATEAESRKYDGIAKEWTRSNNPGDMFVDAKNLSESVIMEFLANQEGITTFRGGVGKPLDKRLIKQRLRKSLG